MAISKMKLVNIVSDLESLDEVLWTVSALTRNLIISGKAFGRLLLTAKRAKSNKR